MKTPEEGYAKGWSDAIYAYESKQRKNMAADENRLLTPRDWQAIAQREAGELLGTPEGAAKLVEAKRYGMLADEIERLRGERDVLKTVMIAAAEEIAAHWGAHCDAEGYGPQNLLRRLEAGIPSEYGYTAGAFAELKAERDALRAAAERFNFVREWMVKHGLLQALRCQPEAAMAVGDYWVLRKPAIIDGGLVEGYGKTEEAAIDAAMAQT